MQTPGQQPRKGFQGQRNRRKGGTHAPSGNRERPVSEVVLLAVAAILITALGYVIAPVLSPFVLLGAIIYILYPLRTVPLARRLLWLSIGLFLLWFIDSILGILAPFIAAFLIAYILNPLVSALERKKTPRWASSLGLVLLGIGIALSVILFVFPSVIREFEGIIAASNVIARDLARLMESGVIFDVLSRYGIPVEQSRALISEQLMPRMEGILTALFGGVLGLVTSVSSLALHIINVIIIPFLLFYLLTDYPTIVARFRELVPVSARERVFTASRITDEVLGSYLRGAIIVAIIQGAIATGGLWLIGVQYSLVLGIMTGLLNFIPYIGLITSLVISSIVAVLSAEAVLAKVAAVILLYLSQKLLEATVLGPKIIGSKVGLHPVLLILCLLVFGHFLGLFGMLIAVPVTALINTFIMESERSRPGRVPGPAR
jgi:predicted PurR-regulated permease PerM